METHAWTGGELGHQTSGFSRGDSGSWWEIGKGGFGYCGGTGMDMT